MTVEALMHAGAQTFPNPFYRFVDIRDVANAHIQALFSWNRYTLFWGYEDFA